MAPPKESSVELNMTPMIDIVFLLLIFFMVVSEMARIQEANVQLPFGKAGLEEDSSDKSMLLIVNVALEKDEGVGHIIIGGHKFSQEKMKSEIQQWAMRAGLEDPVLGTSNLRVQIRADRHARMKAVQYVLDACMDNKVYKTVIKTDKRPSADVPPGLVEQK